MSTSRPSLRFQAHLRTPSPDPDAGLRDLGHYERRLPKWRYRLRQSLIPVVRWETPYLARMQEKFRSPFLDSYFALTANLGTHTCFMMALPICFWCGYPSMGTALVHMLAAGVYLSGYVKDLVCLPRPLSPPLQRITMSGSAALEYGFPSTHTTNAVSVAMFCLYELWQSQERYSQTTYYALVGAYLSYAISISVGRMYCGMHGFFDVIFGLGLGAFITFLRLLYGSFFDHWVMQGDYTRPLITAAILALAVRFHPEPADNCPCFDDSVAFIGVVMGTSAGTWHFATLLSESRQAPLTLAEMYQDDTQDLIKSVARVVGGIVTIFIWRAVAKPLMLRCLPPIFRFVAHWGVAIPRRYFLQSKEYTKVPTLRRDDQVLPPASEISEMLSSIRRRKRTISIGPQSEADVREYIANREQLRRDARVAKSTNLEANDTSESPSPSEQASPGVEVEPSQYLAVKGNDVGLSRSSLEVNAMAEASSSPSFDAKSKSNRNEEDRKIFALLEKPRIRYDVEVITKVVVYAGIGWLAVEGNPLLFRQSCISYIRQTCESGQKQGW